jgi:phosphopantothenoylcysteine synthetase/decarboxylase
MNVVVTGGGTIAPIDDVRYIANTSTGRFSAMITEACLERGAAVWHIHAPSAQLPYERLARFDLSAPDPAAEFERLAHLREQWLAVRDRLYVVPIHMLGGLRLALPSTTPQQPRGTVAEYRMTLETVLRRNHIDIAFLAMAVSDFEPNVTFEGKIETPTESLSIPCQPTMKVIGQVRDWAPNIYLVGFKLLSRATEEQLIEAAEAACIANRADVTVANDLQTVRSGSHEIHLVRPGHAPETIRTENIAERLVDRVFTLFAERDRGK